MKSVESDIGNPTTWGPFICDLKICSNAKEMNHGVLVELKMERQFSSVLCVDTRVAFDDFIEQEVANKNPDRINAFVSPTCNGYSPLQLLLLPIMNP